MSNPFFNAHHSPIGSFSTFTVGMKGSNGGLGLELAGPACEGIYVGVEETEGNRFKALPFFGNAQVAAEDFDVEGHSDMTFANSVTAFADDEITRTFGAAVDEWKAGDLTFRIYSPPRQIPDVDIDDAKTELTPAIIVDVTLDNRHHKRERRAFFGYGGSDRYAGMRILSEPGLVGVGQGTSIAIASPDLDLEAGLAWQPEAILSPRLKENLGFMLGSLGLLVGKVPGGQSRTFRFAIAFFKEGTTTTGIAAHYLYRRWFNRIEDVLQSALAHADKTISESVEFDKRTLSGLSDERQFMLAHAIRSYYGSTQLLETADGKPLWVVHEGEYRMMNTFDLTVDQAFFELIMNPWTVRNVLDQFVDRYSYQSGVRFPGDETVHPGGIAFTHDMGVSNNFAPMGYSGYEQAGLTGCFSFMSSEELVNWVLTAALYVFDTKDSGWSETHRETWLQCLSSLENRDNPDPALRSGVMGLDDARCQGGAEITTYDSLDTSLGQARNNLYLAVKGWSCYVLLEKIFEQLGEFTAAKRSSHQAHLAATTIIKSKEENGLLPAVIGEGVDARIIPAIEALVYPKVCGVSHSFHELVNVINSHFEGVLKTGICLFDDGGWKLSSTSNNSWLSKIYLCQYVAEQVLNHAPEKSADVAHQNWLLDADNIFFAWSDQMLAGKAVGSRYYPRGVTAILWLAHGSNPLEEIRTRVFSTV